MDLWYPPVTDVPKPLSYWISNSISQTKRPSSCVDLSQLHVSCIQESPIRRIATPQSSSADSSTVSSSCTRTSSESPILTALRKSADALVSTCKRQTLQRITAPKCLVSPYQQSPSPNTPLYLYILHLPKPELLAKLADISEQCFHQKAEQTIGLLFSKPISDSDYVCRLPLYLTNGMARARILLARRLRLSAKELSLVVSGHRVLTGLTIDVAHSSSGGLGQVLSTTNNNNNVNGDNDDSGEMSRTVSQSAAIKPGSPPLGNRAADFPQSFHQLAFSPEKSNIFGLTVIISLPEKTVDLEATQAILDWEAARCRYTRSTSPVISPVARNQGLTRGIFKQYPAVLGQLLPSYWPGRVVRPCSLPDKDSGAFAVVECGKATGASPVVPTLALEIQQRLNADKNGAKMLSGNLSLSTCDYSAIISPKINMLLGRIDPSLPLAVCCRLTRHKNAAQVTAGMKVNSSVITAGNRSFSYLADTCAVYPLSAWQWFFLSLLPTVLHQLSRALLSVEFAKLLVSQLGLQGHLDSTVLIPDRVDAPVCALSDLFEKTSMDIHVQAETSSQDLELDRLAAGPCLPVGSPKLPQPSSLLEAITLLSAKDAVNLERLEWLGDSLLQLIGSLTVYTSLPSSVDEGILTKSRVSMVCNFNLSRLAVNHEWGKYCMGRMFSPKEHYLPPCFTVPHSQTSAGDVDQRLYVELTEKSLADMVEAIIGYFLTKTDLPTACSLLSYLGLSSVQTQPGQVQDTPTWSQLFCSEAVGEDAPTCPEHAGQLKQRQWLKMDHDHLSASPPLLPLSDSNELSPFKAAKQVDRVTKQGMPQLELALEGLQAILGYWFNETRHLVEALSPPASPCSGLFGSYQRLEFLGDAVLGHVVSMYLYAKCPGSKPGDLTECRSNLVKNDTLALSVVEENIHHFILCNPETIKPVVSVIQNIQATESSYSKQLEELYGEVLRGLKVKVIADIFEALIGAIFVDTNGSLPTATRVIHKLLDKRIASYLEQPPINVLQKLHLIFPDLRYEEFYSDAVAGEKYTLKASVSGKEIITTGQSRSEARLALAKRLNVSQCLSFHT